MALLTADTEYGRVRGVPSSRNPEHTVFRGIPFAQPPTGALRFAAPQRPASWEGERLCDGFSAACIQDLDRVSGTEVISEDCLYLNVYTPAKCPEEKLPVLFWIYGGGFGNGFSGDPEFDGEAMNAKGAVVVTINYRCGVFGFFTLPELEERNGFAGNVGLLDQIAALEWVRDNIAAFGGDPGRVLVFGQSAGGMSTRMLLTSPEAKGLFSRAVIESGGGLNEADLVRSREEFTQLCRDAMEHAGLSFEDLMEKDALEIHEKLNRSAREIATAPEVNYFQPFVDGRTLTEVPGVKVLQGDYMDIPIINMTVAGDAGMFSRKIREDLPQKAREHLGAGADEAAVRDAVQRYMRGFSFSPSQTWAQVQAQKGRTPIRTLYMDRTQPKEYIHKIALFGTNTPHSTEISYLFGTLDVRSVPYEELDYKLSDALTSYWVNFAATGDPNGEGLPEWPPYTKESPLTLHVGDEGIQLEQVVKSPEEQHVLDYTKAHPGMLCSLEGF